jgi:hypothetical protein
MYYSMITAKGWQAVLAGRGVVYVIETPNKHWNFRSKNVTI